MIYLKAVRKNANKMFLISFSRHPALNGVFAGMQKKEIIFLFVYSLLYHARIITAGQKLN